LAPRAVFLPIEPVIAGTADLSELHDAPRNTGPVAKVKAAILSDYFVLWLSAAYFVALAPFIPTLYAPGNLANLLSNIWPLLVVAVGQTFVLTIAGIDLSQGAVMGFTSTLVAALVASSAGPEVLGGAPIWHVVISENGGLLAGLPGGTWLGVVAMLVAGMFIGAFNGLAIAWLRMPAFMVTLVTMIVISAFAIWLTQSENIRYLPETYIALGKGDIVSLYLGPQDTPQVSRRQLHSFITWPAIISLGIVFAAHLLLNRTVFGRQVTAIGANRRAAEISGVPVRRVIALVFILSAFCATVGAILYSARLEAGRPTLGEGAFLLDVIGATVIGGTSLFGGRGKIVWTLFGVIFFVILANSLNLMNLSAFHIDMAKGGVILAAALLDVARRRYELERGA
jgi:ribose/xylose/arabinose/galactoside ABC-type transport system permease subunit